MEYYPVYCGGKFIETSQKADVTNPFTGEIVGRVCLAGRPELETAIEKALSCQNELSMLSSYDRSSALKGISDAILSQKDQLADLLCQESAKPIRYAITEVERAAQTFLVASEECKRPPDEYIRLDWTPSSRGKEGIVRHFPIGLIAGISPFNFPLNLPSHKIAPAIAAGCPIILKPATKTPLSMLKLARIIDGVSLPMGSVSILPMDRKTGSSLVTDERFKLISFTGSPDVGWEMKKNAGKKKVQLELGGNAGVIVCESADLEKAVDKCITGGFSYSGQVCIHAQRIFADEVIFDQFLASFKEKVSRLKYGNPLSPDTDVSVMIDLANAIRVEDWINEAVMQGASVVCGGKRQGSFVEPTIITGTNSLMKVNCKEVFGPVVVVEKFSAFSEALDMCNDTVFGLQAGVFTSDLSESFAAFHNLKVGGVIINDVPTFRADHMPYGGVGESGLGREGVKYAMKEMLEPRIMVFDSTP